MEDSTTALDIIQEEMSHVPLSELMTMQNKIGLKAFRKIKYGLSSNKAADKTFKRENKNRPTELSARRPVPRIQQCPKSKVTRDPRFDDLSGEFSEKIFKHTYGFLTDVKRQEKMKLEKIISKTKNKEKKSELKQLYNRMEQQELAAKRKDKHEMLEKEWKKTEQDKIKAGKKPYFMKKSEKKALFEAEYQKELNETGKMQKYLTRKSKKMAAKEKRKNEWSTKDL
uniref:rRNA biogenesis protein RRP36 n=2 Tax=Arion vulgaris TaxID=1028688 RepID=A0A0B7B8N0_9EUPU